MRLPDLRLQHVQDALQYVVLALDAALNFAQRVQLFPLDLQPLLLVAGAPSVALPVRRFHFIVHFLLRLLLFVLFSHVRHGSDFIVLRFRCFVRGRIGWMGWNFELVAQRERVGERFGELFPADHLPDRGRIERMVLLVVVVVVVMVIFLNFKLISAHRSFFLFLRSLNLSFSSSYSCSSSRQLSRVHLNSCGPVAAPNIAAASETSIVAATSSMVHAALQQLFALARDDDNDSASSNFSEEEEAVGSGKRLQQTECRNGRKIDDNMNHIEDSRK
uniref:Uncharacterized protein n=1 Tax=Anopheles atroparvus TaxID=41427 RepID=A0A182J068_ANOAO